MFKFIQRLKKPNTSEAQPQNPTEVTPPPEETLPPPVTPTPPENPSRSWFSRLKQGLSRTRHQLTDSLSTLLLGKKTIDSTLLEDIENILLSADVGVETTEKIIQQLTAAKSRKECHDGPSLLNTLQQQLCQLLAPAELTQSSLVTASPTVILVVGVNGNGKTTTIGKMAHYYQHQGKKVMLAAADTFRAAAIEQLQVWGERNQIPVVAQQPGSDSAAVAFDAFNSAKAKNYDVLMIDTAGRLHTHNNLMDELKKIKRVLQKIDPHAPHASLLVIDASTGQNALKQANAFNQAIGIDGLVLTKLDGTAKAGILFAITDALRLPVHFIGVGEGIDDLQPFHAREFVDALFAPAGEASVEQ